MTENIELAFWPHTTASYAAGEIEILSDFNGPYGLTVDDPGNIYISDLKGGRIIRLTADLRFNGWLGMIAGDSNSASGWHLQGSPERGSIPGMFEMVHSVTFDQNGNLYAADYANGRIQKYSPDGAYLGDFFKSPPLSELAFDGIPNAHFDKLYNLWVSDFDGHRIYKFAPDGQLTGWMGERDGGGVTLGFDTAGRAMKSSLPGGFFKPHMVKVDSKGNFLVVETGNHRVQKFSPSGKFIGWIGGKSEGTITNGWEIGGTSAAGSQPGAFNAPVSLQIIDGDSLIIADNANHRIQKFDSGGQFVGWLGGKAGGGVTSGWEIDGLSESGTEAGAFAAPFDVTWKNGKLYVADGHNDRVQIIHFK